MGLAFSNTFKSITIQIGGVEDVSRLLLKLICHTFVRNITKLVMSNEKKLT